MREEIPQAIKTLKQEYKSFLKKFPLKKTDYSEQSEEIFDYLFGIFATREQFIYRQGYLIGKKAKK